MEVEEIDLRVARGLLRRRLRAGRSASAKDLLNEALAKANPSSWSYGILKYLHGDIDEQSLLASADSVSRMTLVHCYLGLDLVQRGRRETAIAHFRWIEQHGDQIDFEYGIAMAECIALLGKANRPPGSLTDLTLYQTA